VLHEGDPVQWKDTNGYEPVLRTGRIMVELDTQFLVQDPFGVDRFVFKSDPTLCMYKENN